MKILIYLFLPLIAGFLSCNNNTKDNHINPDTFRTDTSRLALQVYTEYMDWNSVKINGKVHTISKTHLIYKALGKPDSIISGTPECDSFFDTSFKIVHINGAVFQAQGDSIVFWGMDFKKNGLTLSTKNLILSYTTTLKSLKKTFPDAVRRQSLIKKSKNEKIIGVVLGATPQNMNADFGTWILTFKNDRLISIEHHIDC